MKNSLILGWREWVSLPDLGINAIKVKIDSGARTSALHAYFVEPFEQENIRMVRFGMHPIQGNEKFTVICETEVHDLRVVTDSGGHREERYVIKTPIVLGERKRNIELTLTNRDTMKFRMLLGRTAMDNDIVISPAKSYLLGKELSKYHARKEMEE
ncbi:RimK/LysX family protein [Maridesulfovibrio sp.]|uniref:ATP-dependent zinc protease family protein n=1 Tax=Maridesulfovibrio sp. TaxID=2795000 RepID=UPI0029F47911|nr:RimK/LysX family protein [Maridesulfovibrio sp.]